jgi:hypothetical protein
MITIRPIQQSDAAQFLALRTLLDAESRLMMLEPGERDQNLEHQHAELRLVLGRDNHTIYTADTQCALRLPSASSFLNIPERIHPWPAPRASRSEQPS